MLVIILKQSHIAYICKLYYHPSFDKILRNNVPQNIIFDK